MKKILFIASADLTAKTGGGFANLAFFKTLKNYFGEDVDVIPFCNIKPVAIPDDYFATPKSTLKKILDFPKGIIHRFNPWIYSFLKEYGNLYQCCIINDGLKGDVILEIKKYIKTVIVIHHNCEVDFQNDNRRPTTLFGLFPYWVKRNERLSYQLADLNLFLTTNDLHRFKEMYGKLPANRNKIVGVYLPTDEEINVNSSVDSSRLAICGGLNNVQTIKGIQDFSKFYPLIEDIIGSDFQLIIAGRNPGEYINKFVKEHSHVNLIANPDNMSRVLMNSGIFICPINVGSGLKLRIMDGLKLGMPILTHEVSSHGYECFWGKPWFKVYRNEKEFRNGLRELKEYCETNDNIRAGIIDSFKSFFSYESGSKRFIEAVQPYVELKKVLICI